MALREENCSGLVLDRSSEKTRAVFGYERSESVIEDKKHTKEKSDFEKPPFLGILDKALPATRPLLSLAFGAVQRLFRLGLQATSKPEPAFATPVALQTLPLIDEL